MSFVPAVFLNNIDTCANIEAMVSAAQGAGIKVILGTIPPWGPGPLPEGADPTPDRYTRIAELNTWFKQYGLAQGIVVGDYHEVLQAPDEYVAPLTVDGVHPSADGFELMTGMAVQAILQTQPVRDVTAPPQSP
jgi:lysophospholipase L1-like esterase